MSIRSSLRRWLGIDSPAALRLAVVEDSLTAIVPRLEELEATTAAHVETARRLAYYESNSGALSHWCAKYTDQKNNDNRR